MITLAHISDIHLSPMPEIGLRDLMSKRLTGFLNWKLKRNEELNSETLGSLVAHMQAQNADFTAVTGDLVNLALPGVTLTPMPVAPRQIPFHAGANYFELETRNSDLWRQLEASGGVAMHIAGDFPGLDLAFWAIRS